MGNTRTPDSTPYHDGYRMGKEVAQLGLEQAEELAKVVPTIKDYDEQEEYLEGFAAGYES